MGNKSVFLLKAHWLEKGKIVSAQGCLSLYKIIKYLPFIIAALFSSYAVYAAESLGSLDFKKGDVVDFSAREVFYEGEKEVIEARGNVTAIWKDQEVNADIIRYYTQTDKIEAFGNVRFKNEEGYVSRTKKLEVTGDFKKCFERQACFSPT